MGGGARLRQQIPCSKQNDNIGLLWDRASCEPDAACELRKVVSRGALARRDLCLCLFLTDTGNGDIELARAAGIFGRMDSEGNHVEGLLEEARQGDCELLTVATQLLSHQLREDGMECRRLETLRKVVVVSHGAVVTCQALDEEVPHGQVQGATVWVVWRDLAF